MINNILQYFQNNFNTIMLLFHLLLNINLLLNKNLISILYQN